MPNNNQFHVDLFIVPMKVRVQNMISGLGKFVFAIHFAMAGGCDSLILPLSTEDKFRDAISVLDDMAF
jgi:hypothetical protein